jgi:hypothetical protein
MQSVLEIATPACRSAADAERQLRMLRLSDCVLQYDDY